LKRVLVATGTSDNKRTFAVNYIKSYLQDKGIEAEVTGDNIYELNLEKQKPDVIVTIGPQDFTTNIPIIDGTVFITKIGMDPVCNDIIDKLK